ncbi:hypothetical protein CMT41_12190 [Colwellia sp. MT41]|uniref:AAA family ATPase n=1 Tax=Colwellia sp. MT41 TaxID=58049 RepID=UPI000717985B|nr:ATP-binding protein [Colwellia sp. MT41]ALO35393.1 hypothetical protein CMT41_12190 [Colwellia sp. MT41]
MIKKFGVKNFFSFEEGMEVSFELDKKVPEDIRQGLDTTTVLGIKGANGSGKTNIIKAIDFLTSFCTTSAKSKEAEGINIRSFFDNEDAIEFYIDFNVEEQHFFYELEITEKSILREVLYRTNSRKVKVFERVGNEIVDCIDDVVELKAIKLKSNASLLSLYDTYKFTSKMEDVHNAYTFFLQMITNVNSFGYYDVGYDYRDASEKFNSDPELFKFVKNIIASADNGIKDIEITNMIDSDGKKYFYPVFIHEHKKMDLRLTYHDQSSGTKALFKKMSLYWLVLKTGGFLAFDEFDIHIHSMILPLIIEMFTNKDINKKNAQFIFTAHNTEIIDTLGKYRTILVNKEDNASYCYRLDEITGTMIRNGRPITPLYLAKKLGGIPSNGLKSFQGSINEEL